jgi:hypothetical protein
MWLSGYDSNTMGKENLFDSHGIKVCTPRTRCQTLKMALEMCEGPLRHESKLAAYKLRMENHLDFGLGPIANLQPLLHSLGTRALASVGSRQLASDPQTTIPVTFLALLTRQPRLHALTVTHGRLARKRIHSA